MGREFEILEHTCEGDGLKERVRIVKEAVGKVCSTEEAMTSLLNLGLKETESYVCTRGYYRSPNAADRKEVRWFCLKRLQLLQYKDRLETFVGIHMGRYHCKAYSIFRSAPLHNVAVGFACDGKIGALSLLLKRHTYSLAPYIFQILNAIPETIHPYNYRQLLPDVSPPKAYLSRLDEDWVENCKLVEAMALDLVHFDNKKVLVSLKDCTEHLVKISQGIVWPSKGDIVEWYMVRAREIDDMSGLLENSISLLSLGVEKGLQELENFLEDVSCLFGVVFAVDPDDNDIELGLSTWEQFSRFDKFKTMLQGAKVETLLDRLREQALPFAQKSQRLASAETIECHREESWSDSFLGRWLAETALQNNFTLCVTVLNEGCLGSKGNGLFKDEKAVVEAALDCVYACSKTDVWSSMTSILAKLPGRSLNSKEPPIRSDEGKGIRKGWMRALRGTVGVKSPDMQSSLTQTDDHVNLSDVQCNEGDLIGAVLEGRVQLAENHVEAGELLQRYKAAKPLSYFLTCADDVNGTKQFLHTLLLKFSRKQPARSDSDWATLWRDLCTLQRKAFPFLDKEYFLSELCQAMLESGKFSLAQTYLTGTGTTILRTEKAEKLVLQAAREYFYSAPSLDSQAIENARQCLSLLPESQMVIAESNLIDAITVWLPSFEVTLLPVQFCQLKDRVEAVKLAISSNAGVYRNVQELLELGRLLGLSSSSDIGCIEEAIAREACAAGDFRFAQDLCLGLVNKGHRGIWDLCAAFGRGLDAGTDLSTRRKFLGFALSHCDAESVPELLSVWKEFDLIYSSNVLEMPAAST